MRWDSVARQYVPGTDMDDLAATTFGQFKAIAANDNQPVDDYDPNTRFGDFIQTFTGKQFWPMDPHVEDVDIQDIAHALAMQCRYAGHCLSFYSVAEHSVHIADWLLPRHGVEVAFCGLMHDGTETWLVDVPRPVKPHLGGYKAAEANIWRKAMVPAFGLPDEITAAVHEADSRILLDERAQNMSPAKYVGGWPNVEPLGVKLRFWQPPLAKEAFLDRFNKLSVLRGAKVAA
jgi:hypothetical protein